MLYFIFNIDIFIPFIYTRFGIYIYTTFPFEIEANDVIDLAYTILMSV